MTAPLPTLSGPAAPPAAARVEAGATGLPRARWEPWAACALLAATSYLAFFLHAGEFGLYEDDYSHVAQAFGQDPSYLVRRLGVFLTWPQGRPLHFYLPNLFAWLGDHLGGLGAIYAIGYLIVAANACLFFLLFRRRFSGLVAFTGAAALTLFPADSTRPLLVHDFQLQASLLFFLAASHLYLSGRTVLAYLVALGSLLTYESAFFVFLAVPLWRTRWDRALVRELARNAIVLALFAAAAVALRTLLAEDRVTTALGSAAVLPLHIAVSMIWGPALSLGMFVYGPLRFLGALAPAGWVPALLLMPVLSLAVFLFARHDSPTANGLWRPGSHDGRLAWLTAEPLPRLLLVGLVMTVLGYLVSFTHYPPTALVGRGTSVHFGATVGGACVVASLVGLAAGALRERPRLLAAGSLLLGVYLGVLVAYGNLVQQDFVRSWVLQRQLWSDVQALAPDIGENTVLIHEYGGVSPTRYIETYAWTDPIVLLQAFRFPATWQNPPRLFTLESDWTARVQPEGDHLRWLVPGATWDEHWETFPEGNVIVLRREGDRLVRLTGTIDMAGRVVALKTPPPAGARLDTPPGPLHRALFGS